MSKLRRCRVSESALIRIGGEDKYETAKLIADQIQAPEKAKVVIVNGEIKPKDAKNIQKKCAELGYAILYVETNSLSINTIEALKKINPIQIYIVGNKTQISSKVVNEVMQKIGLSNSDIIRISKGNEIK